MNNLWSIKFYETPATSIDVTSYVKSVSIVHDANLPSCGRSSASIVLDNSTGIFTPNGSGTYASKDWFKFALLIQSPTYSTEIYSGLPQTFEISNASTKESTVTITALDILTIAGRSSSTTAFATSILFTPAYQALEFMVNGYTSGGTVYYAGVDMPFIGGSVESQIYVYSVTASTTTVTSDDFPAARVGDWINNNLMVSGPCTAFIGNVYIDLGINGFIWNINFVDSTLNKTAGFAHPVNFGQKDGSFNAATEIPFTEIDLGYNFDQLINSATAQDQRSFYTPKTVTNTASTAKYGVRNVQFNSTCTEQQTDVDRVANFWPNRYSSPSYTVRSVTTTQSAAEGAGIPTYNFVSLCNPQFSMWDRAAIRYKTVGMASAVTINQVINRIEINISPSDTIVTVGFLVGVDNQSFELNSSTYGILNGNRLG